MRRPVRDLDRAIDAVRDIVAEAPDATILLDRLELHKVRETREKREVENA